MIPRVLICAPSEQASSWQENLSDQHFWTTCTEEQERALALLEKQVFHLCIWHAENDEDVSRIYELKRRRPDCAVVVTSTQSSPSFVVSVMKAGAVHFEDVLQKGLNTKVVEDVLSNSDLPSDSDEQILEQYGMVGRHPKMIEIYRLIERIKSTECSVLITGESGTGKELVARAIHLASSRSTRPMVAVNCAAIPGNLLESELFGHTKGAFTGATQNRTGRFQLAGRGTMLLDEISELSLELQAKLLRAIQTRQFEPVGSMQSVSLDARIIAASNQDLELAVRQKQFREDLFYRLNVLPIFVPPLRQRRSDIPLLVHSFVKRFSDLNNKNILGLTEDAMKILVRYNWPGNVRELENLMERVIVLKDPNTLIDTKDFPTDYFRSVDLERFVANVALPEDGVSFNEAVNDFENELILQALKKTDGNKNQAASLLRLNRTTLVEKLKRKGLKFAS